jgi:hypothetical protein
MARLSKNLYYLVDNIYASILSQLMDGAQEQSGWTARPIPNWESEVSSFGEERYGERDGWAEENPAQAGNWDGSHSRSKCLVWAITGGEAEEKPPDSGRLGSD